MCNGWSFIEMDSSIHPPLRIAVVLVVVDWREDTVGGIAAATTLIVAGDCHTAQHSLRRLVEAHVGVERHAAEETASVAA